MTSESGVVEGDSSLVFLKLVFFNSLNDFILGHLHCFVSSSSFIFCAALIKSDDL